MKTTNQADHSKQTAKNNALMLKIDRERESRRIATEQRDKINAIIEAGNIKTQKFQLDYLTKLLS